MKITNKKSGGPKSKPGKKVVSQNATKTGAYARSIVLSNEDKEAYNELVTRYMHEFQPSDMAETTMVNNLANLTWKKIRLDQYEQNSLMAEWDKPVTLSDLKAKNLLLIRDDVLWLEIIVVFNRITHGTLDDIEQKYEQYFIDLKNLNSQPLNPHYLERFFHQNPTLLEEIKATAKDKYNRSDIEVKDLLTETAYKNGKELSILEACAEIIIKKRDDIAWYRKNEADIEESKLKLKDQRVIEKMNQTDFNRAHDDLDRSFYRTLTELRKQQQWRREQNEIVVISSDKK